MTLFVLMCSLPNSGIGLSVQPSCHVFYTTVILFLLFTHRQIDTLICRILWNSQLQIYIFRIMFPWLNKQIGMSILRSRPKSGTADPFVCNMIQLRGLERWIWDDFLGSPSSIIWVIKNIVRTVVCLIQLNNRSFECKKMACLRCLLPVFLGGNFCQTLLS